MLKGRCSPRPLVAAAAAARRVPAAAEVAALAQKPLDDVALVLVDAVAPLLVDSVDVARLQQLVAAAGSCLPRTADAVDSAQSFAASAAAVGAASAAFVVVAAAVRRLEENPGVRPFRHSDGHQEVLVLDPLQRLIGLLVK